MEKTGTYLHHAIRNVPIPMAGVALGLAALGNLWQPVAPWAHALCGTVSLVMALLVAARIALFPKEVREDLANPMVAAVSATFLMSFMQLATYLAPYFYMGAAVLWFASVACHLCLMAWFSVRHMKDVGLSRVFPTFFIAYVGIIVASATSPVFGMQALGLVLFWLGFAAYPLLLVLVTMRYVKHPMPEAAQPLFCIYAAPASLSLVGYLTVVPDPNPVFVTVLLILGQALFLMVLTQVPRFLKGGFKPSFAAMTFPFVISAAALGKALDFFQVDLGIQGLVPLDWVCGAEAVFAAVMVFVVVFGFARFLHGHGMKAHAQA